MKLKHLFIFIPLLILAEGVIYLAWPDLLTANNSTTGIPDRTEILNQGSGVGSPQSDTPDNPHFIAYYFHGTVRCPTCLSIEAYAKEAIEDAFPEKLELGDLEWKAVNTDEAPNVHFVSEFNLDFSTLIFAELENGKARRWEKQEKVWELVYDKEAFMEYVTSQARIFMEAAN